MKPWEDRPLWWRLYVGQHQRVYQAVAQLIGHLGIDIGAFWDRAKSLPCYDKLQFENAARAMTLYQSREPPILRYVLHPTAVKVLRLILGPPPDDPEYVKFWATRMISVRQMRAEGREPSHAKEPPVPIMDLEIPARQEPTKKPAPRRKRKTG